MAYCRWAGPGRGGEVYLYQSDRRGIICCDCVFTSPDDTFCNDRFEAVAHLMQHMEYRHVFSPRALTMLWVELFEVGPVNESTVKWLHGKPCLQGATR